MSSVRILVTSTKYSNVLFGVIINLSSCYNDNREIK